ncbi:OmpH family outer membrane protein [uncultured Psychroserpens sp.]|uniref:OmpH family outer membrane protein n=1 Tax=uncultured Psychroserpens sp. TaxID=255436 RepID=UPI002610A038|nr:OmpH family outer membrane protein [uncultured Psychroserpens sp.]
MNKYKILPFLNTALIIGLAIFCATMLLDKKAPIAYVNNVKLFNEFQMTKEMRAIGERQMQEKSKTLDDLVSNYQSIEDKTSETAKNIQNKIITLNKELQEFQQGYFNSVNEKITDRLDAYLKEFGKAKDLKLILGSNILYAKDAIDITDEALLYVNERYSGLQLK